MSEYLQKKIDQYLLTLNDNEKDEYYDTERELSKNRLVNFYKWLILEPDWYRRNAPPQEIVDGELFYIQNEGFCGNALFWWAIDGKGYVTDIRKAGKYTKEKALDICQRKTDHAYPVNYIDGLTEGQKLIIDTQYVDRSKEMKE